MFADESESGITEILEELWRSLLGVSSEDVITSVSMFEFRASGQARFLCECVEEASPLAALDVSALDTSASALALARTTVTIGSASGCAVSLPARGANPATSAS